MSQFRNPRLFKLLLCLLAICCFGIGIYTGFILDKGSNEIIKGKVMLEMISEVKIFAYDIPEELITPPGLQCEIGDMYYSEIILSKLFRSISLSEESAQKADFYFVNNKATCHYHHCYFKLRRGAKTCMSETSMYLEKILDYVQTKYSYWNQSEGTDHVFVFSWDVGYEVMGSDSAGKKRVENAIHLTPFGVIGTGSALNFHKNIVIPPYVRTEVMESTRQKFQLNENKKIPQRRFFATFRGTIFENLRYSNGVRQSLLQLSATNPKLKVSTERDPSYLDETAQSTFALCPSGWSPWTQRLFESFPLESIPIIYSDNIQLPFEEFLDYREFSIKILDEDVNKTMVILETIDDETIVRKREYLSKIYPAFLYHDPPLLNDAFHFILRSLSKKKKPFKLVGRIGYT